MVAKKRDNSGSPPSGRKARQHLPPKAASPARAEEVAAAIPPSTDNLDREAQRQRAEQALAAAAREWSVSFDAMADAVSLHATDFTIENVNQSLCDLLVKSKQELIGKKCYQVFHGSDAPIAGCPHEMSRATLRKENAEVFDRTCNQWLAVSASPIFDDAGRVLRFVHVVRDITGRKRADEALRESERILALAQRIAHVGYWERDLVTNKSRWSEETFRIVGLEPTAQSFDYRRFIDHVHPDDRQRVVQAASDTVAGIRPYDVEYRVVRPDGSIRHIHGLGEVTRDRTGKPLRLFGSATDITEAKSREQEIKRLNRLYAALSELHQTVVRVKSPAELFDAVCRIAAQRAGFRVAWVGQHDPLTHQVNPIACAGPDKDYVDKVSVFADDRPEGRGPVGNSIRQRKTCISNDFLNDPCIAAWRHAVTEHGLRAVAAMPIYFGDTVFGALTVYADEANVFRDKEVALLEEAAAAISLTLERLDRESQHQHEEEALRDSEERYRRLFEVESDALVLMQCDTGRFLDANEAALRLYGYEREEFLRMQAIDASAEPDKTRMSLAANQTHIPLRWHRKKDGTVFPVEITTSFFSYQGRQVRVVAIRDISERKRVEDDLRAATRAAQAANRAKSEFLANMSHEIRTPMTAILGFSDLLMAQNLSHGEQCEFLEGIQRNGRALLELIGDILDLSRIEADKLTLEKIDCPLQQIIDDVLAVVQVRSREKQLSLHLDRQYPLPERIHTDPLRLRQILVNLAGNAVKFTENGEVRIAVRCLSQDGETARMQFAVSDTGIGIPADKIAALFQPFTQADASVSRRYAGAGLGLAISKRLARALGGDIEVASEPGKGSTFTLTIDAGSLQGVPMLQSPPAPLSADESSADPQPLAFRGRLLLVEDDPDLQRIIRLLLRKMMLAVNVAKNGQMACDMALLSKAEGRPYDLILMDIQMPGMNGFEATQNLRQHGWQGPIIALTAHAMAGDRERCLAAGCNDYIVKPLIAAGLQEVLARHMAHLAATPPFSAGHNDPDTTAAVG